MLVHIYFFFGIYLDMHFGKQQQILVMAPLLDKTFKRVSIKLKNNIKIHVYSRLSTKTPVLEFSFNIFIKINACATKINWYI